MRDGRIVAHGPKHELLTERRLSDLFGRDITLVERNEFWNAW
jgi:iron complex transport system ATP-binding protein